MLQNYKRSLLLRTRIQNAQTQVRAFSQKNEDDKNFNPFKVGMGGVAKGESKGTLNKLMNFFGKSKKDLKGTKSSSDS